MGKLIKYELKKQMLSKIVVGVLAAICEVLFLVGLLFDNVELIGDGIGLIFLLAMIALFYFSFETIITYSNDLKTKQSYMLFLIPRNMYQVVGAKMITAILQILLVGVVFVAVVTGDMFIFSARYGEIEALIELIKMVLKEIAGINVSLNEVLYVICTMLVIWSEIVLAAMLAITFSTTMFANKRYKGVISFFIFYIFEIIISTLAEVMTDGVTTGTSFEVNALAWIYIGVFAGAMVICYFVTSWLLDKKISV